MRFSPTAAAALVALCAVVPIATFAACGEDKIPTYDDIESVTYGRSSCLAKCVNYQVDFGSRRGNGAMCSYLGFENVPERGRYSTDCSKTAIPKAIAILKSAHFYDLNWNSSSSIEVLDVAEYTLIVRRCGVTTSLGWPHYGDRKDIPALFDALDRITKAYRWEKVSNTPGDVLWKPGLP